MNSQPKEDKHHNFGEYKYTQSDIVCEIKRFAEYINENAEECVNRYFTTNQNIYDKLYAQGKLTKSFDFNYATLFSIITELSSSDNYKPKLDYPDSEPLNTEPITKYVIDYDTGLPGGESTTVYDKENKTFITTYAPL